MSEAEAKNKNFTPKVGNTVRAANQNFESRFQLSKLKLPELKNKILTVDMNMKDYSLILGTIGGYIQKITVPSKNTKSEN